MTSIEKKENDYNENLCNQDGQTRENINYSDKDLSDARTKFDNNDDEDDDEDNVEIPHKDISEMTEEELKEYFDKLEEKLGKEDDEIYDYEDEEEEESSQKLNETIGDFYEGFQNDIDSVLVLLGTDDIADKRKDITEHNIKLLNKISRKLNELKYY